MKRREARDIGQGARGKTRHEVVKSLASSSQKLEAKGISQVTWGKVRKYKAKKGKSKQGKSSV